jgi:hypothetical protein
MTSREFNQDTGRAKKAAANGPVFVTDRGESTHVLLNIDEYRRLTHTGKSIIEQMAMPELEEGDDFDPVTAFDALNDEIEYSRRVRPPSKRMEELMHDLSEIAGLSEEAE